MITQREVAILTGTIKKRSGLDIPPDAALAALYALADYNFSLIPRKPEPHKYAIAVGGGPKSDATANVAEGRRGRSAEIVNLIRARPQAALRLKLLSKAGFGIKARKELSRDQSAGLP